MAGPSIHRPSNVDRKILVWTKTYPTLADIPESVTVSQMKKAKDKFRIRVNIWMGVATVVACAGMIYMGRKSAREGETLHKQNLQWHKDIKAQHDMQIKAAEMAKSQ